MPVILVFLSVCVLRGGADHPLAPSLAKSLAVASPMPDASPVINATLPSSLPGVCVPPPLSLRREPTVNDQLRPGNERRLV